MQQTATIVAGDVMVQENVGKRIRELRLLTGLSQEKFAASIGMDRTYFASVESGKRNIAIVNLSKIAEGLNVSLSELVRGV
ncbi:MAG: helix-turn-helix transcriptional regulator [Pseudoflavonifractor sp.]